MWISKHSNTSEYRAPLNESQDCPCPVLLWVFPYEWNSSSTSTVRVKCLKAKYQEVTQQERSRIWDLLVV